MYIYLNIYTYAYIYTHMTHSSRTPPIQQILHTQIHTHMCEYIYIYVFTQKSLYLGIYLYVHKYEMYIHVMY